MTEQHINAMRIVYDGYCEQWASRMPDPIRVRCLTSIGILNPDSWLVVGIAPSALAHLASFDFKPPNRKLGIHRAHIVDRDTWMREWLELPEPLPFEEWLEFYTTNDRTVLRLSAANYAGCDEAHIAIDPALGLFRSAGFAPRYRQKHEAAFLRQLHAKVMT